MQKNLTNKTVKTVSNLIKIALDDLNLQNIEDVKKTLISVDEYLSCICCV